MHANESWDGFCNRVLINFKQFGFESEQKAIEHLTGVDMKDNSRKGKYYAQNVQQAFEEGLYKRFVGESVELPTVETKELNSFYKTDEIKSIEDAEKELEVLYDKLGRTEKSLQKVRDDNVILRKLKRLDVRDTNFVETTLNEMLNHVKLNSEIKKVNLSNKVETKNKKSVILQFNDVHANFTDEQEDELVKSYIEQVESNFDGVVPDEIVFAYVGDLVNHSKYSKKYTNLYSQGEASIRCYKMLARIIGYFIDKYPKVQYKACSIVGNEGEFNEYFMNDPEAGYDNADYYIYQLLRARFSERVEFLNNGNDVLYTFKVQDKTVAINHGYHMMKLCARNNIEEFFHKMAKVLKTDLEIDVDLLLVGHIHQQMSVNNRIFRAGSWEGSNSYSKYALGIAETYRTQNMIVFNNGKYHCRILEF